MSVELVMYNGRLVHPHWLNGRRVYLPPEMSAWPMRAAIRERCRTMHPDWDWDHADQRAAAWWRA